MGILENLLGRTKILRYQVAFGSNKTVGVNIEPCVPEILGPEYIHLWASYEAKIIFNLGFPNNLSAMMALGTISKVAEKKIGADTDCFERADLTDVIRFSNEIPKKEINFTGEFYAKGSLERLIKTHFPVQGTEQQVVYSGLALMQYAINMNMNDSETLDVLTKTAQNFVALYESGMGGSLQSVIQIPTLAYMQAIGVA
jgi:hypothetical protein